MKFPKMTEIFLKESRDRQTLEKFLSNSYVKNCFLYVSPYVMPMIGDVKVYKAFAPPIMRSHGWESTGENQEFGGDFWYRQDSFEISVQPAHGGHAYNNTQRKDLLATRSSDALSTEDVVKALRSKDVPDQIKPLTVAAQRYLSDALGFIKLHKIQDLAIEVTNALENEKREIIVCPLPVEPREFFSMLSNSPKVSKDAQHVVHQVKKSQKGPKN